MRGTNWGVSCPVCERLFSAHSLPNCAVLSESDEGGAEVLDIYCLGCCMEGLFFFCLFSTEMNLLSACGVI